MPDPFVTLRTPIVPTPPDPGFAARLRDRLQEALGLPEGVDVTETTLERLETEHPAVAAPRMALTPYLAVADARRALDWYAEVFGARLRGEPIVMPDGRIGHAELDLGGALLMLADEHPEIGHTAPRPGAGAPVTMHLETADIDTLVERALAGGAVLDRPPEDRPYGHDATVIDPFGHRWQLMSPVPPPAPVRSPGGTRHGDAGYVSFQVPDLDRALAFYRAVLGWTYAPAERSEARRVLDSVPRTSVWGGHERGDLVICWRVDDVAAAAELVRTLGGTATDLAEMAYGTTSDCFDDQGMAFYLWQPTPEDTMATAGRERPRNGTLAGDLAYLTLNVVDSRRFRAFFGELLGWHFSPGRVADGWNVDGPIPMAGFAGGATRASAVPMWRVDDIEAAVGRVLAAGGTATPVARMPYGLTSDCTDDQGTPFYLGQL